MNNVIGHLLSCQLHRQILFAHPAIAEFSHLEAVEFESVLPYLHMPYFKPSYFIPNPALANVLLANDGLPCICDSDRPASELNTESTVP